MAQSQMALPASAGRQVEDNPAPPCGGLCSLTPGERVRVRGISANDPVAYRTSPGTVELEESSGGAGCFLKRLWELRDGKWRALHSAIVPGDRKSTRLNSSH